MLSLYNVSAQAARTTICAQCLRQPAIRRSLTSNATSTLLRRSITPRCLSYRRNASVLTHIPQRSYASKSSADELLEAIQDQYATARDEFEIATEETEKKSVYAASDREAARDELQKLKEMYEKALEGSDGEEVKKRVGSRIRELDSAVEELNKADYED